ncbi:MAG: LysR family transcriptional regulator [Erysipelotrichaceae bacterium]|nr:LysR family transcriptional regulator [Erysipelotrichaceae bacterium]
MDYKDLNYLTSIEKYHTMTKASQMLHVSQPTLSKCLKNVEDELGLKLFKQVGHTMVPTYEGTIFLEQAHKMLILKQETDQKMNDLVHHKISKLVVGLPTMRCSYVMPNVLPGFHEQFPNVEIEIVEGSSEVLDDLLLKGEIDIALYTIDQEFQKDNIQYDEIGRDELVICVPKDHPVKQIARPSTGKYPILSVSDIENETILLLKSGTRTRQVADEILKKNHTIAAKTFVCPNLPTILGLINKGFGVSFVFEPHIASVGHQIDIYAMEEHYVDAYFVAAYRKDTYLSNYAQDFIRRVKEL